MGRGRAVAALAGAAVLACAVATSLTRPADARAVAWTAERDAWPRFTFERPAMGTVFRILVHAPDGEAAAAGAEAAFGTVERLDSLFSDYRTDSEVARIARSAGAEGPPVAASPELLALLADALEWSRRTGGAFDVTVGPLTRLWRWSARRGELPSPERLAAARTSVGHEHVRVDPSEGTVRLERRGMALDLGGIAKGWAADAALRELEMRDLPSALVDAGGDVLAGAPPPGEPGWKVGMPGGGTVVLAHGAVATSGDLERWLEVGGVRYSHVVDPRTGLGVADAPTVTVVAPDAATADVLASALTVLGPDAGAALIASEPGAAARVRGADGATTNLGPETTPWRKP